MKTLREKHNQEATSKHNYKWILVSLRFKIGMDFANTTSNILEVSSGSFIFNIFFLYNCSRIDKISTENASPALSSIAELPVK